MKVLRTTILGAAALAVLVSPGAAQMSGDLPLKHAPRPTAPGITAADLMTRVYIFADDSMQGREAGTRGHVRGTDYIVRELTRLGVKPAGENGTYYQNVPVTVSKLDVSAARLTFDGQTLKAGADYHPFPGIQGLPLALKANATNAPIVFGGRLGAPDAITPEQATGKLVVLLPPINPQSGQPVWQAWAAPPALLSYTGAAALLIAGFEMAPPIVWNILGGTSMDLNPDGATPAAPQGPALVYITRDVAARMIGVSNIDSATVGTGAKTGSLMFEQTIGPSPVPVRNVVAMVEGSDPALKGQLVTLSAHSDHDGIANNKADHDSLRLNNLIVAPMGAESQGRPMSGEEQAKFRAQLDSVRKLRPARMDSIMNGADDDASGSMGLLEVAEYFATMPTKPKRSLLFVWNVAEEKGLYGSEYFTERPTVPRDSMIANVNIDMIGRGSAKDIENGGPDYLQLLGSRRLSTEYGNLVEEVNKRPEFNFRLDYQFDAQGHPQQYYCRSDHWNFARWGIPTVFLSTGSHVDYHMPTDEPQYLDYTHYAKVTSFVAAFARTVADAATRPVVDKPKPDPHGPCQQ